MTNNESMKQNNQNSNRAISAAELAVIGGLLATFGDAISTISAVLALEEARESKNNNNNDNDNNDLQKQIDHLTNEVKKLKKQVNNDKSRRF